MNRTLTSTRILTVAAVLSIAGNGLYILTLAVLTALLLIPGSQGVFLFGTTMSFRLLDSLYFFAVLHPILPIISLLTLGASYVALLSPRQPARTVHRS